MSEMNDTIRGWIAFVSVSLSLYFLSPALHSPWLMGRVPIHSGIPGRILFYGLWLYYWLAFWKNIEWTVPSCSDRARKIRSWTRIVLGGAAACALGLIKIWPAMTRWILGCRSFGWVGCVLVFGFGWTFPLWCFGSWLMVGATLMGLEMKDPFARHLNTHWRWGRKINHEKYIRKAHRRGLTYIGYDVTFNEPVNLSPTDRRGHFHLVGATGTGKTHCVLFPMIKQDIENGLGVLFIDAKGSLDNAKAVYQMACDAGREKDFLFFSLVPGHPSVTYNPLRYGNATQLTDKIAMSIRWSEPFYERLSEEALLTLFRDLDSLNQRVTLNELHQMLKEPPAKLPNFRALARFNKREIQSLRSEIAGLVNTDFGYLFDASVPEIDLMNVYKEGKIVHFALDTLSHRKAAMRLGRMITQDLNTLCGLIESEGRSESQKPLAVTIDEYQAFGTEGFIDTLTRGRSSGLWVTLSHQSLGDLKAIGPQHLQQVVDSTNAKLSLRVNAPGSAESFSDALGTRKFVQTTKHVPLEGEAPATLMGYQRISEEYIIHPSEVKNLADGCGVFKSPGRHGRLILPGLFPDVRDVNLPVRNPERGNNLKSHPASDEGNGLIV
jgi:hypothetical protein